MLPFCMTTLFTSADSLTIDLLIETRANRLDETIKTCQDNLVELSSLHAKGFWLYQFDGPTDQHDQPTTSCQGSIVIVPVPVLLFAPITQFPTPARFSLARPLHGVQVALGKVQVVMYVQGTLLLLM